MITEADEDPVLERISKPCARNHRRPGIRRTAGFVAAVLAGVLVTACGGGGGTTPSRWAPPAPVANEATSVGASVFTATWSAVNSATSYQIDVSWNSAFGSFVSGYQNRDVGNTQSVQVAALTPNTPYYYRVYARNAIGQSAASSTVSVTTLWAETFSGSVTIPDGVATYLFPIRNNGHQVLATLTSLNGASSIGVLVGMYSGSTCLAAATNDRATVGSTVVGTAMPVGTGCIRVYATGAATGTASYTMSVQHP